MVDKCIFMIILDNMKKIWLIEFKILKKKFPEVNNRVASSLIELEEEQKEIDME